MPVSLRSAPGRKSSFSPRSRVAFDEAPLGSVHRRAANPETGGDLVVAHRLIRRQQDLRRLSFRA